MLDTDRVLIIDIDAHHGNGNALVYMKDKSVCLLDIYNYEIYPSTQFTKDRIDINVPLRFGTKGDEYLSRLDAALNALEGDFKLAYVVAGTDVLASDPLGGLSLTVKECAERDALVAKKLNTLSVPFVFLGGGGYSSESADAIAAGIRSVCSL
ncbi:MAG: hypothetical protein COB30_016920 [Ectothiorhodospiraceae bacterium]|nr:hypothetical protein [Ectothiorhodospiraceae bacterium]